MRAFGELLRVVFVSFEFLFFLCWVDVYFAWPRTIEVIGEVLTTQENALESLPIALITLCGVTFQQAWKLTTPREDAGRELLDWPAYWQLRLRRNVALSIGAATAIGSILVWLFSSKLSALHIGFVSGACAGVSAINTASVVFAAFTLREITEK